MKSDVSDRLKDAVIRVLQLMNSAGLWALVGELPYAERV